MLPALLLALAVAASQPLAVGAADPAPTPMPAPAPLPAPAQPSPAPPPSPPTAAPLPAPTPQASPAPQPTPVPQPTAPPTASPSASATPNPFAYLINPPPPPVGEPSIFEIALLDRTIHPGAQYLIRVTTTTDVSNVSIEVYGQKYFVPQASPGHFLAGGVVPTSVPFFMLNRDYTATIAAQTADGRTYSTTVTVHLGH